ncbi:Dual specificity phosphatase, catalytic domain [Novipirellula aureliae]|uniref:Dual specificity phosphatase, catalytic domain n=1 Tax=Novipirellula aureliae TaxID=2527966 RepID=A0A5C6DRV5_9BACT|nr:dual specificity protein phosphatase family protein [Novipirellula aureliae]TWU37489.1 Dual specificity phosphatase, catalytic domain [Novipirellula aureliae]
MHIPTKFVHPEKPTPCNRTYWVIDDVLLAGAYPGRPDPADHRQRIASLFNAGMRTFINLQEENETNNSGKPFVRYDNELRRLASDRSEQIAHLRFPIPDGGTTSIDRMRCILDAIDLSLAADRPVYIHCFGGMGRTGTAVCCWLLRHRLISTENVFERLTQLRQADVERASWKAPENADQAAFVLSWLG